MTLDIVCQVAFCSKRARFQVRDLDWGSQAAYVCKNHLDQAARLAQPPAGKRPVCLFCGVAMPVPEREQGGGRTKLYCSGRCRTAAHRARPAPWAPDTLHGALGTVRA